MQETEYPLAQKQLEFILNAKAKWNLAHGSVRCGKTVGTLFAFMLDVHKCPNSDIYIVGHTSDTAYRNVVKLILESPQFVLFRPFCSYSKYTLHYMDKSIRLLGAKDEGAIKNFQGNTWSLGYCDEITLYPESIIDMIDTRLSPSYSKGYASMNPTHPNHKVKQWIDKAEAGNKNYYALHFTLDDNPYVDDEYKNRIRDSLSGIFYKRNYLGLWCLAEGAIFDFFDKKIHVVNRSPAPAEYWVAGIDYGAVNPFAMVIVSVNTGRSTGAGKRLCVVDEFYWDPKKKGRQKTHTEFADEVQKMCEQYAIKAIYCDPSAEAFQLELRRRGIHVVDGNNDVQFGIEKMTSEMKDGNLSVLDKCTDLIREIESYVWDSKSAEQGYDEPLKKNDHAVDALRYICATHKVSVYDHEKDKYNKYKDHSGRLPGSYLYTGDANQPRYPGGKTSIFG